MIIFSLLKQNLFKTRVQNSCTAFSQAENYVESDFGFMVFWLQICGWIQFIYRKTGLLYMVKLTQKNASIDRFLVLSLGETDKTKGPKWTSGGAIKNQNGVALHSRPGKKVKLTPLNYIVVERERKKKHKALKNGKPPPQKKITFEIIIFFG